MCTCLLVSLISLNIFCSVLPDNFEPTYKQLVSMNLDKSPFVIISVIGQELLAAGYHASSLVVLESALKIGKFLGLSYLMRMKM